MGSAAAKPTGPELIHAQMDSGEGGSDPVSKSGPWGEALPAHTGKPSHRKFKVTAIS